MLIPQISNAYCAEISIGLGVLQGTVEAERVLQRRLRFFSDSMTPQKVEHFYPRFTACTLVRKDAVCEVAVANGLFCHYTGCP